MLFRLRATTTPAGSPRACEATHKKGPAVINVMRPNPLRDPYDRRLPRIAGPCVLVIFGVTGDLSTKS